MKNWSAPRFLSFRSFRAPTKDVETVSYHDAGVKGALLRRLTSNVTKKGGFKVQKWSKWEEKKKAKYIIEPEKKAATSNYSHRFFFRKLHHFLSMF